MKFSIIERDNFIIDSFFLVLKSSDPSSGLLGILQNQKYLGGILLAAGFLLSLMGIMLFFEGNLLRIGNVILKMSLLQRSMLF